MPRDDGGPAFPTVLDAQYNPGVSDGMSLRDYIAIKALAALIPGYMSTPGSPEDVLRMPRQISGWAYAFADAMLAARGEG